MVEVAMLLGAITRRRKGMVTWIPRLAERNELHVFPSIICDCKYERHTNQVQISKRKDKLKLKSALIHQQR